MVVSFFVAEPAAIETEIMQSFVLKINPNRRIVPSIQIPVRDQPFSQIHFNLELDIFPNLIP